MKVARFFYQGKTAYGIVGDRTVAELDGDILASPVQTGRRYPLSEVKLLVPCEPTKILGIGANYAGHIRELGWEVPPAPHLGFLKPHTSLIAHEETITLPRLASQVHHEGELAVIVGRTARHISAEAARDYMFGFTCANDVSATDMIKISPTVAKAFDTFCPVGPWLVTDLEPDDLDIEVKVSGEVRQQGNTSDMLYNTRTILSYVSDIMTLHPGDVILTGSPQGSGPLKPGDVVEVTIEGIGTLRNPVGEE